MCFFARRKNYLITKVLDLPLGKATLIKNSRLLQLVKYYYCRDDHCLVN